MLLHRTAWARAVQPLKTCTACITSFRQTGHGFLTTRWLHDTHAIMCPHGTNTQFIRSSMQILHSSLSQEAVTGGASCLLTSWRLRLDLLSSARDGEDGTKVGCADESSR